MEHTAIITFFSVIASSLATFLITRKKTSAQTQTLELNNVSQTIKIYKDAEQLKTDLDAMRKQVGELQEKLRAMELENKQLQCKWKQPRRRKTKPPQP